MDFELSQRFRYTGNVLLADRRCKTHPELATLFDHTWLEGEPKKIELLIINLERWLVLLVAAAIDDLRLFLA